jgi:hypothetical protein
MNGCRTFSSPATLDGREGTWVRFYELGLLVRREQDDPFVFPESCENPPCHAKVWMVHVTPLGCSGEAEGDPAILLRSHLRATCGESFNSLAKGASVVPGIPRWIYRRSAFREQHSLAWWTAKTCGDNVHRYGRLYNPRTLDELTERILIEWRSQEILCRIIRRIGVSFGRVGG